MHVALCCNGNISSMFLQCSRLPGKTRLRNILFLLGRYTLLTSAIMYRNTYIHEQLCADAAFPVAVDRLVCISCAFPCLAVLSKARFPLPELTGDRFPLPVNSGRASGNTRLSTRPELMGNGNRSPVNSGSGNRA